MSHNAPLCRSIFNRSDFAHAKRRWICFFKSKWNGGRCQFRFRPPLQFDLHLVCYLHRTELSGTSSAFSAGTLRNLISCTGTLWKFISHLHRNPPEPHQPSAPEPSGTLRNLFRNLVLQLHRIAPELFWAKDPIASFPVGEKNEPVWGETRQIFILELCRAMFCIWMYLDELEAQTSVLPPSRDSRTPSACTKKQELHAELASIGDAPNQSHWRGINTGIPVQNNRQAF